MSYFIFSVAFIALSVKLTLCEFPLKPCFSKSKCSCENVDGLIDLHPLANNDGTPRFRDIPDPDGKTFYSWNPCYAFNETGCQNVAMCQIKDHGSTSVSLGNQSSLMYVSTNLYGQEYQYTQWGGANNSGHVIITCDAGEEGQVTRRPDADFGTNNFYLELKSKYACPIKINGSTTAHSTSRTTRGRRPTTPAFIGTAKTPSTTMKPLFDTNTLSWLMIGVISLFVVILVLFAALFVYTVIRLNSVVRHDSGINQGYGSQNSVTDKQRLVRHTP